jgi:hypothetical protein
VWYTWRKISGRKKLRYEEINLKGCVANLGMSRLNINVYLEETE